jgi:hypothetical protein
MNTPRSRRQWLVLTAILVGGSTLTADVAPEMPTIKFKVVSKGTHKPGPEKSPDGKLRVEVDGVKLQLIDVGTGKPKGEALTHPERPRKGMAIGTWAFSPDGKLLAVGLGDYKNARPDDSAGGYAIWDVASGELVKPQGRGKDIGWVISMRFREKNTLEVNHLDISGK